MHLNMYKNSHLKWRVNQTKVAFGKLRVRERATADALEVVVVKRVGGGVGKFSFLSASSSGKGFFMSSRLPLPQSPSSPSVAVVAVAPAA